MYDNQIMDWFDYKLQDYKFVTNLEDKSFLYKQFVGYFG
jgi:hypothetical protein